MTQADDGGANVAVKQGRCRTFWTGGHLCLRPAGHQLTGPSGGHGCASPKCPMPAFFLKPTDAHTIIPVDLPQDVWGTDASPHYRCGVQRNDLPWREVKSAP